MASWRRRIYVALKMPDLRRLENVWFPTSWRLLIYDVTKTPDLCLVEDVRFTSPWRRSIYNVLNTSMKLRLKDVMKASVKRHLCSNVVAKSLQRQKKWFFLILHFLKFPENFKCFCLYLSTKFCKLLRFFNHTWQLRIKTGNWNNFLHLTNFLFWEKLHCLIKTGFLMFL